MDSQETSRGTSSTPPTLSLAYTNLVNDRARRSLDLISTSNRHLGRLPLTMGRFFSSSPPVYPIPRSSSPHRRGSNWWNNGCSRTCHGTSIRHDRRIFWRYDPR
jgi:hypothetical protein